LFLFETELVRREMAFTAEQQEKLRKLKHDWETVEQPKLSRNAPPEEWENFDRAQGQVYENFCRAREKVLAKIDASIEEMLLAGQKQRLDEITFQAFFPYAFYVWGAPHIAEFLSLSGPQRKKIVQIQQDYLSRPMPMHGSGGERTRWRHDWDEERAVEQEATNDIIALLTAEQRKRLTELEGKKIPLITLQDQLWAVCMRRITATGQPVADVRPGI
jgi:hypothetical protein